ncbi:hypothetical protein D3C80_1032730 [compost metagenome]
MPAAVGITADIDGAIGLLVPAEIGDGEGAASVGQQLIAGAGAGEVRDRLVGVVSPIG